MNQVIETTSFGILTLIKVIHNKTDTLNIKVNQNITKIMNLFLEEENEDYYY